MRRIFGTSHLVSPIALIALFVMDPQTASATEPLQLRVPQSFSSAASDELDGYAAADDQHQRAYNEVEIVRERYPDGRVRVERQVTLDAEGNYVNHGTWKMLSQSEAVVAEGQYDMGKRVGSWTRWYGRNESPLFNQFPFNRFKPPFASQAIFNNDLMDGEWLIVDADQKKVMQISLSQGQRNGLVMTFLPNGKTYRQASYDRGVPVGDVMEADGKTGELKRIATYVEGRRIVTKTANYPRSKKKKSEEMFLAATTVEKTRDNFWTLQLAEYESEGEDLRHGPSKLWFENGQLQVDGFYQNDKRSGTFTYWYANGQVAATGEYVDDLPSDVWVWWHTNGQKAAVGKYLDGALVDEWRWWNEDGKLAQRKTFDGTETTASTPQEVLKLGRAPEDEIVE